VTVTPPPGSIENKGVTVRFACKWLKKKLVICKVLQARELGAEVEKEQNGARPMEGEG